MELRAYARTTSTCSREMSASYLALISLAICMCKTTHKVLYAMRTNPMRSNGPAVSPRLLSLCFERGPKIWRGARRDELLLKKERERALSVRQCNIYPSWWLWWPTHTIANGSRWAHLIYINAPLADQRKRNELDCHKLTAQINQWHRPQLLHQLLDRHVEVTLQQAQEEWRRG